MRDPIQQPERVTLGVDTHAEQHVAAALDERGRLLGTCTFPTTLSGFAESFFRVISRVSRYPCFGRKELAVRKAHR